MPRGHSATGQQGARCRSTMASRAEVPRGGLAGWAGRDRGTVLQESYSVGMFETIRWRCYAHVADRRGAERVVGRIGELLPHTIEIKSYERYWKFPELAELRFVSPLRC